MHRKFIFSLFLIGVSCGGVLGQSPTAPPTAPAARHAEAPDQAQVLRALLEEVRLLRVALERSQSTAVMMQVVVERLRLQQDSVNRLAQKLDDSRSELAALQLGLTRLPEHIADVERRMNGAEEPSQRTLLESEMKAAQLAYEDQRESANRQRQRVEQLKVQLQEEQRKLDDLFERFARFEQPPSDRGTRTQPRP
jgi:antitoxin component HigA of HigAB toxin-antitoxin module